MGNAAQRHVIVVLGCGLAADGSLDPDAGLSLDVLRRATDGAAVDLVVFAGCRSPSAPQAGVTEAELMACAAGAGFGAVATEVHSWSTLTNALFVKRGVFDAPVNALTVVRGPNHSVLRVRYVFRAVFGPRIRLRVIGPSRLSIKKLRREVGSLRRSVGLLRGVEPGDDVAVLARLWAGGAPPGLTWPPHSAPH